MGSNQYWAGRVYDMCVYHMTGAPEGSPNCFYGEARNRTCDPWFARHRFIPYTTAALGPLYLLTFVKETNI